MLKNTKTSFKIGGSVGIIILLLGITVMFGMYQMSKVSNEIIEISQEYTPLNEIVSNIKFQKSHQATSLEKIIRYTDTNKLQEIQKVKEEFWRSGETIGSDVKRAKNIVNVGINIAKSEKSIEEFRTLFQKLSNIKTTHEQYETLAGDLFLELNDMKLNDELLE